MIDHLEEHLDFFLRAIGEDPRLIGFRIEFDLRLALDPCLLMIWLFAEITSERTFGGRFIVEHGIQGNRLPIPEGIETRWISQYLIAKQTIIPSSQATLLRDFPKIHPFSPILSHCESFPKRDSIFISETNHSFPLIRLTFPYRIPGTL
jgi:hypothetical protein